MDSGNQILDVIGVGFGPSNLAFAVAVEERQRSVSRPLSTLFLEKQDHFVWHQDMLLPGSKMQISFLKDLVTLRNPHSRHTFISYLHEKGRLSEFINLQTFFPSRIEFNDYLAWVAARVDVPVHYGEEVVAIEPEADGIMKVVTRNAQNTIHYRARNVVIGMGGRGRVPPAFTDFVGNSNVYHSSRYLQAIERLPAISRVAVVGAGQSSAELFLDLTQRFPEASVDLFCRGQALRVADDSPFVNEIFDPLFVDEMYGRPEHDRKAFLEAFASTNYSVVDRDVIERIYEHIYQQRVSGHSRHSVHLSTRIESVRTLEETIVLDLEHHAAMGGRRWEGQYDAVFLATGYERSSYLSLLESFQLQSPAAISRHYRLNFPEHPDCNVYLQGGCESSHGLSDTLLSILPARSAEILDDIAHHETARVLEVI